MTQPNQPDEIPDTRHLADLFALADQTSCPHCREQRSIIRLGTGYAVETVHERHCPEHEDNQPTHWQHLTS